MTIEYLKKADISATIGEDDTRNIVSQMLSEIEAGGEQKAKLWRHTHELGIIDCLSIFPASHLNCSHK